MDTDPLDIMEMDLKVIKSLILTQGGSMRLGRDALVFTCHLSGLKSIGFLSQTFLEDIKAETILIPQLSWNASEEMVSYDTETMKSLEIITTYSPFKSEIELLNQFHLIDGTGTKIVIFNLRTENGQMEFDFESDPHDILIRPDEVDQVTNNNITRQLRRHARDSTSANTVNSRLDYSLRVSFPFDLIFRVTWKFYISSRGCR